ncbi:MAG TPA: hypothetical protein VEX18_01165 [Polyangiaceae bacterium]|nr:hypothetical protein [Polyangiaceae bacterium]
MKKYAYRSTLVATVAAGLLIWQQVGAATAEDVPTISYSGFVEDEGVPVDGLREIGLSLWKTNNSTNSEDRACMQAPVDMAVARGWFTVGLSEACVTALRAYPNLSLQFTLDGVDFPVQSIGAVPYSLRALEYNNGSRLRRIVIRGTDGSRQEDGKRWWDSVRAEECTFKKQGDALLCTPDVPTGSGGCAGTGPIVPGWYSDSSCQNAVDGTEGAQASSTPLKYTRSGTATSGIAHALPAVQAHYGCALTCGATPLSLYRVGTDIDASEFVSAVESHD